MSSARLTDAHHHPATLADAIAQAATPQERRELAGILMGLAQHSVVVAGILNRISQRYIESHLSTTARLALAEREQAAARGVAPVITQPSPERRDQKIRGQMP